MKIIPCLNYIVALLFIQSKLKEQRDLCLAHKKQTSSIKFKLFPSDIIIFL